jgi:hypothetical protein
MAGDPTRQAQLQQGGALIVESKAAGRLKLILPGGWPLRTVTERFLFNLTVRSLPLPRACLPACRMRALCPTLCARCLNEGN